MRGVRIEPHSGDSGHCAKRGHPFVRHGIREQTGPAAIHLSREPPVTPEHRAAYGPRTLHRPTDWRIPGGITRIRAWIMSFSAILSGYNVHNPVTTTINDH